jgi:hypothetical protein
MDWPLFEEDSLLLDDQFESSLLDDPFSFDIDSSFKMNDPLLDDPFSSMDSPLMSDPFNDFDSMNFMAQPDDIIYDDLFL